METVLFEKHGALVTTNSNVENQIRKLNLRLPVIEQKTRRFNRRKQYTGLKPLLKVADAKFTNSEVGPLLLLNRSRAEFQNELQVKEKSGDLVHAPIAHVTFPNGEQRAVYAFLKNYISMNDYIKNVATRTQRTQLAAKLGAALKTLHDNWVVHGDLHPENVMLQINNDGAVVDLKFIDLPQSRVLQPKEFKKLRKVDFNVLIDKLKFLKIKPSSEEIEAFAHAYVPQLQERKQRRKQQVN